MTWKSFFFSWWARAKTRLIGLDVNSRASSVCILQGRVPELMRDSLRTAGRAAPPIARSPMKHQAAEQVLNDVLFKYGAHACDTPNMLETLLRKHGRGCLHEVEILTAALRCGVVGHLRSERGVDPASLARLLVLDTHVPPGEAEWIVSTWA